MKSDIPVVILCGGLGTRLREETEFRPKPMVKIGNNPILWHIMQIYATYGFNQFICCLGYKSEMIKEYFIHYEMLSHDLTIRLGQKSGYEIHKTHDCKEWEITLCNTGDYALKGARLKRIEKYVKTDEFMVTYGDGVADIDVRKLLQFHQSHEKIATVTGVRPDYLKFGELNISDDQVCSFMEKPKYNGNYISGGFFVFNRKIFDYLEDDDNCDLESAVLEQLSREGELMVYKHNQFWACMDTIRDTEYLNDLWNRKQAKWKIW